MKLLVQKKEKIKNLNMSRPFEIFSLQFCNSAIQLVSKGSGIHKHEEMDDEEAKPKQPTSYLD